jgi:hypothetical protein
MDHKSTDDLIDEAMNAAVEWLNFVGQERVRHGDIKGAEDTARLMKRCVDIRDDSASEKP